MRYLILLLAPLGVAARQDGEKRPVLPGKKFFYEFKVYKEGVEEKTVRVTLGAPGEIEVDDLEAGGKLHVTARPLQGFEEACYIRETGDAVIVYAHRYRGCKCPGPHIVPVAVLRLGGEAQWTFRTRVDKQVQSLECVRGKEEIVRYADDVRGVGHGVKYAIGDETMWLSRGTGIIRRITADGRDWRLWGQGFAE